MTPFRPWNPAAFVACAAALLLLLYLVVHTPPSGQAQEEVVSVVATDTAEFKETIEITPDLPICCFDGNLPASRRLMARDPRDQQIIAMVTNILKYAGLAPNFRIVEVDENNAFAMVHNGERILGFGPEYLRSISSASGTDWARLGVMAHEIGHHVQGHVLKKDETVEQAHREELEADEYAGFICGMMGSTERASYSHTALMANFDSDSHPAKSRRIEATKRGWLKAQHIRRTVNKEGTCPIVEVTGPGFETRSYMGTIGRHDAIVNLTRSPDRTVFGTYDLTVNGSTQQYRFTGRSNEAVNKITLEEYFGCEPSATIHLTKALAGRT
ncbi:MAG: M48 family metalloprotease, partial [Verrucomicrobiota bacterium]